MGAICSSMSFTSPVRQISSTVVRTKVLLSADMGLTLLLDTRVSQPRGYCSPAALERVCRKIAVSPIASPYHSLGKMQKDAETLDFWVRAGYTVSITVQGSAKNIL